MQGSLEKMSTYINSLIASNTQELNASLPKTQWVSWKTLKAQI